MATTVLERIYKLTADATTAMRALDAIAKSTANVDSQFQKLGSEIKKFASGVGLGFVAKEMVANFMSLVDAMDETLKSSQKLGISVEALQEWQFALKLSGVESGTFATAVGKVSQGIADIDAGKITDATKALRAFGVTSKDTAEQALEKLVVGFSKMSDGPKKTAFALEIFGKAGKELIPLLNSGAEGLASMRKEFGLMGAAFTTERAKQAEVFNDNLSKLATIASAGGRAIADFLLPELVKLTNQLVQNQLKLGFWRGAWQTFVDQVTGNIGTASERMEKLSSEVAFFAKQDTDHARKKKAEKEELLRLTKIELDVQRALANEAAVAGAKEAEKTDKQIAAAKKAEDERQKRVETEKALDKLLIDSKGALAKFDADMHNKLMKDQEAFRVSIAKTAQSAVDANELQKTSFRSATEQLKGDAKIRVEVGSELIDQAEAWNKQIRETALREEELRRLVEVGTAAQQQYALAQLEIIKAQGENTKGMEKQVTELDVLTKGYNDFFANLSGGVADASDVFKRAVQSILAELLKIWAKKYIIEFVLSMFSGGARGPSEGGSRQGLQGMSVATSASVAAPQAFGVSSFATTTTDAAATAARFTPQMPERQGRSSVEVNVHNNAGAQVDVQPSEDGSRIDIIIEKTRRALAGDLRTGGTVFSKSLESAYALGRARGA